jgi:uncharacterized membrane protein
MRMDLGLRTWVLAGHLLGMVLWMGTLFATYWMLRVHAHAPADARDKLTLMERSLALSMDVAATLAIGCGIFLVIYPVEMIDGTIFSLPKPGWFHAKLAIVVLGILPVHGIVRGRIAKFSRGQSPTVPQWPWSLLLASISAIVILVIKRPF